MNAAGMLTWLTRAALATAALAVAVMMAIGAIDATLLFFGHPVHGALELAELLMVIVVFLAMPDAEAGNKHIRIDLVSSRLPTILRVPAAVFASLLTLLFFAAMAWQSWLLFLESWQIREYTSGLAKLPVYPAKGLFALSLTAVSIVAVANLLSTLSGRHRPLAAPKHEL